MKGIVIFTLSFALFFSVLYFFVQKNWVESLIVGLKECQQNVDNSISVLHEYNKFQSALDKIGSIPYSTKNNCYEHSKLLQKELEKDGIQSSIFVNKNRSHAWLGVWIDANTGHFMTQKQDILELRDKNLEVICSKLF